MNYFRKIIYVNEYVGGVCGRNTGFVKLSKKETRLTAYLNLMGTEDVQGHKLYLLEKKDRAVNKVLLGTVQSGCDCVSVPWNDGGAGELGGEPAGVIVLGETGTIYAGTNDSDIYLPAYFSAERPKELRAAQEERMPEPDIPFLERPQEQGEPGGMENPEMQGEPGGAENPEMQGEPGGAEKLEMQEEPGGMENPEIQEEFSGGEPEIVRIEMEEAHDQAYQFRKLFSTHTKMYPFEDDDLEECVQIAPPDFSDFPKEYWKLGSNTFLLQGYYNYRHLILASSADYLYVGIPGQYHRRDKFLGDMFGFGTFKGIHKKTPRFGDFGYWMKKIKKPQPTDSEWAGCEEFQME